MLNRSGDSGHPCLVPDFRGNGFSFLPLSIMLPLNINGSQAKDVFEVLQMSHRDKKILTPEI
jgi:hypothetical protein